MDGDADFTATFLDDARAPLDNVIGGLNNGWRVTMTTLGSERAGSSSTQHIPFTRQFWAAVAIARDRGLARDALVRQELAWAFTHVEIMRYQGLAAFSDAVAGREPGARASIGKMFWSEYSQRFLDRVANVRGPQATLLPDQPAEATSPTTGRWRCCGAGAARSGAAPRKSSAISSPSGCSACPGTAEEAGPVPFARARSRLFPVRWVPGLFAGGRPQRAA